MDIKIQTTPNPNSNKFILSTIINRGEKLTFTDPSEANGIPLILALFSIKGIKKITIFANTITITKAHATEWDEIEDQISDVILQMTPNHNANITVLEMDMEKIEFDSPEMERLAKIVEKEIRPIMQADGGDITLLKYDTISKTLFVSFEGNCGHCPSAIHSTLSGIKQILIENFDPEIKVIMS